MHDFIIVEVLVDGEMTVLGVLSDSVQEVIELSADEIDPPPRIGTRLNTEFIVGMGKYNDDFIIILHIDRVFTIDELTIAKNVSDLPAEVIEKESKKVEKKVKKKVDEKVEMAEA